MTKRGLILDLSFYLPQIREDIVNLLKIIGYENATVIMDTTEQMLEELLDYIISTAYRLLIDNTFIDTERYMLENILWLNDLKTYSSNYNNFIHMINNIANFIIVNIVMNDLIGYVLYIDNITDITLSLSGYPGIAYRESHVEHVNLKK